MDRTVEYYNLHAKEFCASTVNADMSACRDKFLSYISKGAHILDAGCGSGRDSKVFLEKGYIVTAMDASPVICTEAEKLLHHPVLCMRFEEMTFEKEFDGIWACASLLHVPRSEMSNVLDKFLMALKENGIIYASFKYGQNERDVNGRYFSDYDETSAFSIFKKQGLEILELFTTMDTRENHNEKWVNVIAKPGRKNK